MFEAYEEEFINGLEKDTLIFPIYRSNMRGEVFKLVSKTKWISVRYDDSVKGIGISENMPIEIFSRLYRFEMCSSSDFESLYKKIYNLITDFQ